MAHLNLVMIHPFADGNGRMGRLLQTLVLAREGILAPQFCSIEEYLGRHAKAYFAVLAEVGGGRWSPERDPAPWIKFCMRAYYHQANALIRRTELLQRLADEVEIEVRRRRLHPRVVTPLVEAAFGLRVRNTASRMRPDSALQATSRDLRQLADGGLLRAVSERRGRAYVAADDLMRLGKKLRVPGLESDPFDSQEDELADL
jgi:Fic family protein